MISVRVVNEPLGTVVTTMVVISDGDVMKTEPSEFVIVRVTGVENVVVGVRVGVALLSFSRLLLRVEVEAGGSLSLLEGFEDE